MYGVISSWNIIELCRTFKKRQIMTFEITNLRNNKKKSIISNFDDSDEHVVAGI